MRSGLRAVLVAMTMLATLAPAASAANPTVPSAPTSIRILSGNGYLQVNWTAPLTDGGSALTGYRVYRSDS